MIHHLVCLHHSTSHVPSLRVIAQLVLDEHLVTNIQMLLLLCALVKPFMKFSRPGCKVQLPPVCYLVPHVCHVLVGVHVGLRLEFIFKGRDKIFEIIFLF